MTASTPLCRVLVTGGAGFIGSHTVEALAAKGSEVVVADNLSTGCVSNLEEVAGAIRFERFDLAYDDIGALLADGAFDTVVHAAASAYVPTSIEDPAGDLRDNVFATHRLLAAMRDHARNARLVYVSSAAVYGEGSGLPMRESEPTRPVSPYGISKLAAELYVTMYARLFGLRTCSVRLFSVFGPRLRKQVVWDFMNRLAANPEELLIHGDGTDERDFNPVGNAVAAIMMISERGATNGEVYNVASGKSYSINYLARSLCQAMEVLPVMRHTLVSRPGEARRWAANIDSLKALGYSPPVTYEDGLLETVEWFRRQANLDL